MPYSASAGVRSSMVSVYFLSWGTRGRTGGHSRDSPGPWDSSGCKGSCVPFPEELLGSIRAFPGPHILLFCALRHPRTPSTKSHWPCGAPEPQTRPLNSRYGPQDPPLQLLPKPRAAATPKSVHKLIAPLVSPAVPPCRQETTISPAALGISTPHVPALCGCRLSPIPEEGSPVPSVPSPCSCCGSCPRPCPSFCSAAAHRWRCLR